MPTTFRKNSDILKGSKLMLFYDNKPIGFATSHSLSMTTNTSEVSTKDHGDFPTVIPQNISWEVTAENLYSTAGKNIYLSAMANMQAIDIVFAVAENYGSDEHGVLGPETGEPAQDAKLEWTFTNATKIAEGKALITSFSINAPSGDNATMSVTLTGQGALTTYYT